MISNRGYSKRDHISPVAYKNGTDWATTATTSKGFCKDQRITSRLKMLVTFEFKSKLQCHEHISGDSVRKTSCV